MLRRLPTGFALAVLVLALAVADRPTAELAPDTLPIALSDREFWSLTEQFSEPNGYFVSQSGSPDNLLSNESQLSTVAAVLARQVKPSGVYLGVGPEQNFTYIAATRPLIAFITDIRRGNLNLHLLYKAVFDLSADRSAFVARLFARKPVVGLPSTSSARTVMNAYLAAAPVDPATFGTNLAAILDDLTRTHGFALTASDREGIAYVYRNFHRFGPAIDYTSSVNGRTGRFSSYATILAAVDRDSGAERSFLANEDVFTLVKTMENKNLIVPIVGDFAGPKALRSLGGWLRARAATVSVFYVSNVEQYLQRNGVWGTFCANAAALPLDPASAFLRPSRGVSPLSSIQAETVSCATR